MAEPKNEASTGTLPSRQLRRLKSVYDSSGAPRAAFAAAGYLAERTLPHPHDTRTRVRIELLEEGLSTLPSSPLPPGRHLYTYRLGYDHEQYFLYGFDAEFNPSEYLSKYARKCTKHVNEDVERLENKETFHDFLTERGFDRHLPRRYGYVQDGTFETDLDSGLEELARREGRIVIKEVTGGGGNAVYIGEWDGSALLLRGKDDSLRAAGSALDELDRAIVTEFSEQADYVRDIYPDSTNTIRVLTIDPDGGEPFIAAAAHRIGTSRTKPLDNFSQGRGGLSADIGVETGELSAAATMSNGYDVRFHETHPETGSRIEGVDVPGWGSIKRQLLTMVEALSGLRYVGWDVVVTAPGEFVLVEGNHYPGPAVHQVHRPLLRDERVRAFYERNDVPI